MTDETLGDLHARLAELDKLEAGPHGDVPVIRQETQRARAWIQSLIEEYARGPEAYARALAENKPERSPRVLMGGGEAFLRAREHVTVLPDDERPEQVWIRWDAVPVELREDVISLASLYRDTIHGRKIGRPKTRRRRGGWFVRAFWPSPAHLELHQLRFRAGTELPPGQATVARALLVDGPEFEPHERPVTYDVIAMGLGLELTTVREHLRRIRRRHPELFADLMAERQRRLERWHADVARRRPERSRRWGKQRWACWYRSRYGEWPWASLERDGSLLADATRRSP